MSPKYYEITMIGLFAAYGIMLPLWLIVQTNKLALNRDFFVSVLRMSLQLLAVGYILKYIFKISIWYVVVGVILAMIFFGARTVIDRTGLKFKGLGLLLFLSMLAGAGAVIAFVAILVIRIEPWYEPRYIIPLAGMIIGNSMNGCALALERFYNSVKEQHGLVETLVALGATSREATCKMLRASFRASMLPTLSNMSGMGIVFLPGMMTGQILSGMEPLAAIRYQLVIMLAILGSVAFASYLILILEQRRFFDEYHLLRSEIFNQ
ncbi:MAG TPA: iron export ABC transporter permease subunit FetB [archaeon]|nr:iron export ABC transporter permease subunit FetB [archaeon]